mmetsp:Transcript_25542/g.64900  ORF Transcript_25542/g.64900 Transcript_25542/m.64900 type:complete len:210 (+) Transcript_25542:126-755(+)
MGRTDGARLSARTWTRRTCSSTATCSSRCESRWTSAAASTPLTATGYSAPARPGDRRSEHVYVTAPCQIFVLRWTTCGCSFTGLVGAGCADLRVHPDHPRRATLSPVSLTGLAHFIGLLLFGGYGGGSFLNDAWLFNTRAAAWTSMLPLTTQAADASVRPNGRYGHTAIAYSRSLGGGCKCWQRHAALCVLRPLHSSDPSGHSIGQHSK